jgi:hypothetical protein
MLEEMQDGQIGISRAGDISDVGEGEGAPYATKMTKINL